MRKIGWVGALWLGMTAAGAAGAAAPASDEAAQVQIQQLVERFRTAIVARDKAALERLVLPSGHAWVAVLGDDSLQGLRAKRPGAKLRPGNYFQFSDSTGSSPAPLEEKFSHVRIQTDGDVASVFFDYAFFDGGRQTNHGSETWQLVRGDDGWKIDAIAYSVHLDGEPVK